MSRMAKMISKISDTMSMSDSFPVADDSPVPGVRQRNRRSHWNAGCRHRALLKLGGFLLLVSAAAASAHDTWLVPSADRLDDDGTVQVDLVTGEEFPRGEIATRPDRVKEWFVLSGQQRVLAGEFESQEDSLRTELAVRGAGIHVIAAELHPNFIEIDAGKFNEYLAEEEATEALRIRSEREEMAQPGRELYSKLAKTFVRVGEGGDTLGFARPVGHTLEIVPLSDPFTWATGEEVAVRVLLEGKPAAGLLVSSGREGLPMHTYVQSVTTDRIGVAKFTFDRPGRWYLRTHHLRRNDRAGSAITPATEWESFFASITYSVNDRP